MGRQQYVWIMEHAHKHTIRDLYPRHEESELTEIEQTLSQYLRLILRIFERLESERYPQAGPLTKNHGTLGCTPPREDSLA